MLRNTWYNTYFGDPYQSLFSGGCDENNWHGIDKRLHQYANVYDLMEDNNVFHHINRIYTCGTKIFQICYCECWNHSLGHICSWCMRSIFQIARLHYMVVLLSNLTTAIYLSIISHFGKTSGLNSFCLTRLSVWSVDPYWRYGQF